MKKFGSRQKILLGSVSMLLAMVGDYLLGFGTFGMGGNSDTPFGITAAAVR